MVTLMVGLLSDLKIVDSLFVDSIGMMVLSSSPL